MLKLKLQYYGHLVQRADSLENTLMLGKIEGERRGRQDEMVGWDHRLNGHEFKWTLGVGDGQGGLVRCGSWGHKESDTTEQLNWTDWYGFKMGFHIRLPYYVIATKSFIQGICCCSVTQSCPTLWDPMDCSTLGLPVHHQLLEFAQTHVHRVGDAKEW